MVFVWHSTPHGIGFPTQFDATVLCNDHFHECLFCQKKKSIARAKLSISIYMMLSTKNIISACNKQFSTSNWWVFAKLDLNLPFSMYLIMQFLAHRCKKKNYKPLWSAIVIIFYLAYLALAGLMNLLAQLSHRWIHLSEYNLMPLAFLTKLSIMHWI